MKLLAPLKVRLCRSLFKSNPSEIAFEGCVLGGSYSHELVITNACEVASALVIGLNEAERETAYRQGLELALVHQTAGVGAGVAAKERELRDREEIPVTGNGAIHLRVSYRPAKVGKFLYHLMLRNKRDLNNLLVVPIHSVVTTQTQAVRVCSLLSRCGLKVSHVFD